MEHSHFKLNLISLNVFLSHSIFSNVFVTKFPTNKKDFHLFHLDCIENWCQIQASFPVFFGFLPYTKFIEGKWNRFEYFEVILRVPNDRFDNPRPNLITSEYSKNDFLLLIFIYFSPLVKESFIKYNEVMISLGALSNSIKSE